MIMLAEGMADSMVITSLPAKILGLTACVACVAARSAHLPHKEGCKQANKQLQCIQIDMAGSMPYHLASNWIAKPVIGVLTNVMHAALQNGLWGKARCHPFGMPCTIVAKEQLKKLDDHVTMCFFIGYKYEQGSYRVWDPKRQVVDMAEALFSVGGSWQKYVEAPLSIFSWHFACIQSA